MELPELTDDVIVLRPMCPADAGAHLAGEDQELVRWLNDGHASTRVGVEQWIDRCVDSWSSGSPRSTFGVRDARTGELLGMVEANTAADNLIGIGDGEANLSYGLYPPGRGRGLATRAVELMCAWLGRGGVETAVIRVDPDNDASIGVPVRAGFVERERVAGPDGSAYRVFVRRLRAAPDDASATG